MRATHARLLIVLIRPAELRDRIQLAKLRATLWPTATEDEHARELDQELNGTSYGPYPLACFVAEEAGEPARLVGFIEVGLRSHADGCDPRQPCGFVEGLFVAEDKRTRGVGRALMARAEAWASMQGCLELGSDTWLDAEISQRAHAAYGFEVVDHCVHFRKSLTPAPQSASAAGTLYGGALARLHHDHFGQVARAAASSLLMQLRAAGQDRGHVLDLAAGSGIVSRLLSDAGYDVSGVDISAPMLELARTHAPGAHFERASLWSCTLPRSVAIAAVGEAFSYRTGEPHTWPCLEARLRDFADALQPGGVLLFDVAAPGRSGPTRTRRLFWPLSDAALGMVESEDAGVLLRDISVFVAQGEHYRREQERHALQLYTPDAVEAALTQAQLSWRRLASYDGFELPAGWIAYVATKPSV